MSNPGGYHQPNAARLEGEAIRRSLTTPVELTQRGFYKFESRTDDHGHTYRVQESSAMDPHVWLFIDDKTRQHLPSPPHCITPAGGADLHLAPDMVRQLIADLQACLDVIEGGELPEVSSSNTQNDASNASSGG